MRKIARICSSLYFVSFIKISSSIMPRKFYSCVPLISGGITPRSPPKRPATAPARRTGTFGRVRPDAYGNTHCPDRRPDSQPHGAAGLPVQGVIRGSDDAELHIDIAAGGVGVGAHLMRLFRQCFGLGALQPRQRDGQRHGDAEPTLGARADADR